MTKSDVTKKKVSFRTDDTTDRTDVFKHLCEELSLDLKSTKKKTGVKTSIGFQHIIDLCRQHNLFMTIDFKTNVAAIVYTPSSKLEEETDVDSLSTLENNKERPVVKPIEEDPIPHIENKAAKEIADDVFNEEDDSDIELEIEDEQLVEDEEQEEYEEEVETDLDFENDDFEDDSDEELDF